MITKVNETPSEKLNRMYGDFLKIPVTPIDVQLGAHPVTLANSTEGAFSLNEPVMAKIKNIHCSIETKADQGIIRAMIGMATASRMMDDLGFGYFYLAVLKNAMLTEMSKFFDLNQHEVVWNRPGKSDQYFRDFDNVAGYEIRCYIDKSPGLRITDARN